MESVSGNKQVPVPNPSDEVRHSILMNSLTKSGRLQDYNNILKLLSPPPDILNYASPGEFKNMKVGIIGGGLAGMSSAFELRKLGFDITVFDALESRVGGRVNTYYFDKEKKHYAELGPMRIPISHETTWHYINTFSIGTEPFVQSNPNAFIYVNNTRARNNAKSIEENIYPKYNLTLQEKSTPWDALYDYAVNYNMYRLDPKVRSEILKVLPKYHPDYNVLLNISIRQNFEMLGLSYDAINMVASVDALIGSVMDISYNEVLSEDYAETFSSLYRITGGNVHLPLAFYKSLTSKTPKEYSPICEGDLGRVTWKSGNYVTGIFKTNNNKVTIEYKNKTKPEGDFLSFDYIICAIPFSTLSTVEINPLFSNKKMQAIRELNYINGQKTLLYCKKRFWEEKKSYGNINGGVSSTDLLIGNIVYPSDHLLTGENPAEPGVLVGSYNLNKYATHLAEMKSEQVPEFVKKVVEKVHGLPKNYLDSIVMEYKYINWNNEPWFRGAVAYLTPEQKRIFAHEIIRPEYDSRIFFAGEHTSTTHGWMQGALLSGMIAANNLAYYAKRSRKY